MSGTSEKPVVSLKLFIDEEKNKVLFAEAGKDFVDVLFSLLTLPMGTVVRLFEKYQKSESEAIGCFNNIYASVVNMEVKHFRAEACKQMLLYPRSLVQEKYKNLKLRIDDTEANKCFVCPKFGTYSSCMKHYSTVNTSICICGDWMSKVIQFDNEGFVGVEHTSFIITDDLRIETISAGLAFTVLKDLGYSNVDNLVERIYNVNVEEVVTLLQCLFTSDTPLTDTFLRKCKGIHKTLSPVLCEDRNESEADQKIMLNAYVNKKEGNILYAECGEDFVDLLFTFLAIPLQSVCGKFVNRSIYGCIGNLCRSCSDLSVDNKREAKCVLPYYYKCQMQLLDFAHESPTYYQYMSKYAYYCYSLFENTGERSVPMTPIDSEGNSNTTNDSTTPIGGFVKIGTKFMVTDDLIITPLDLTIGFLKDKQLQIDDVEVQVIIVRKEDVLF